MPASSRSATSRPGSGRHRSRRRVLAAGPDPGRELRRQEGWRIDPFGGRKDPERTSADDLKGLIEDAQIGGPLEGLRGARRHARVHGHRGHRRHQRSQDPRHAENGDIQYVYPTRTTSSRSASRASASVRGVKQVLVPTSASTRRSRACTGRPRSPRAGVIRPAKIVFDKVEVNKPPLAPNYFSFPGAN